MDKITKLCKENNIKLVLIKAPSVYPYWYDEYDAQMKEYSKRHNIDYYNLVEEAENIGLDYSSDTYDGGLHLNLQGATKLSKYFAERLSQNYNLTNYRGDKVYEEKLNQYKEKTNSY